MEKWPAANRNITSDKDMHCVYMHHMIRQVPNVCTYLLQIIINSFQYLVFLLIQSSEKVPQLFDAFVPSFVTPKSLPEPSICTHNIYFLAQFLYHRVRMGF